MNQRTLRFAAALCLFAACTFAQTRPKGRTAPLGYSDTPVIPGQKWKVHDIDRPRPRVVTPGATVGQPPSDAIILFNGKDLSQWHGAGNKPAAWKVENGTLESTVGQLITNEKFGDIQLHLEWMAPAEIDGTSQWRGNSGVMLMNFYEIQVLDSYNNPTYADGQAGAIYGQWPPLVNASRKPGEWQTYDIMFEAPKFEGEKLLKPGYVTVIANGVLLQHHKEISGRVGHKVVATYKPHADEEPLALQNHDTAVRYRNIWVRRLRGYDQP